MATEQEQNKQIVRRYFQAINEGNAGIVDELMSGGFLCYEPGAEPFGPDSLKQMIGMFVTGFPDFNVRIAELIAEDDKVVALKAYTGTHRGEFEGMPATGKAIRVEEASFFRIADGKITEERDYSDQLSFMQQLGMSPTEAEPG